MNKQKLKILIVVLSGILAALLIVFCVLSDSRQKMPENAASPATPPAQTTAPAEPQNPEEPARPEQEQKEERFVITMVGDCTLGSMPSWFGLKSSFIRTIGKNYDHPFANVRTYFENDDFTIVNLEGVFADSGKSAGKLFTFRGPTAYIDILSGSSVEAVNLANNHTKDFGQNAYNTTLRVLNDAGIAYVEKNHTRLYTTKSGLVIGLYAAHKDLSVDEIRQHVQHLKESGAELIICSFHWGVEASYRVNNKQKYYAKAALDAGAHIVYGHHPHVLQRIERNEDSIVFYSLGNFSFGGHHDPRDKDSVVAQQEIIRDAEGNIRLGELKLIPVCISSVKHRNNFQPTPYEVDSEAYLRVLRKLDGTFTGKDLVVSYAKGKTVNIFYTPSPPREAIPKHQPGDPTIGLTDEEES